MDVLIRAGLVLALAVLCYQIFSPFIGLMAWALILAVTLYPTHQKLARKMGGRQGLAATLLTLVGIVVIVLPTAVLMVALGDSLHDLLDSVRDNTLVIPAPPAGVAEWPIVGKKAHAAWTRAHEDLPAAGRRACSRRSARSPRPRSRRWPASPERSCCSSPRSSSPESSWPSAGPERTAAEAIFDRIMGTGRGAEFVTLSSATIRAVALGVLGVAFIQAIVIGLIMLVAGVPFAGALALLVLVLGIAQVPALLVTLPVIVYIWASGDYGTGAAVTYSVLLFVAGMLDNVLKPLLLGRGVDAPMPVVLLGALGGLATSGILGMFIGATLLALGYQIFMWWVAENPDVVAVESGSRAAA